MIAELPGGLCQHWVAWALVLTSHFVLDELRQGQPQERQDSMQGILRALYPPHGHPTAMVKRALVMSHTEGGTWK